jgi:hypothetical protein
MELNKLNDLYARSEESLKSDFAKMRSSLLLIAGEHYNKRNGRFWDRIRTTKQLNTEAKLRLTKNHVGRIVRRYANTIMATAPGVVVSPANEKELSDQKSAQMNQSVWSHIKYKNDWPSTVMSWADDFVGIGEVWTKVWYDESVGPLVGYEPMVDEMGNEIADAMGVVQIDESKPVREGMVKFEEFYGFNVLTDPAAKDARKSKWYCLRKMSAIDDLKAQFPQHAEKLHDSNDEAFVVFDVGGGYRESSKGEVLVREFHFRPSAKYPKGYWCISTSQIKLAEGEYPEDEEGVLFPICCEPFETIQTKSRGIALTDPLRPYQAEINRSASKIAEHQITLGDDKLILQNGAKMSSGVQVPGIRGISVSGAAPTILPGRSGEQYVEYMLSQIREMYQVADLEEDDVVDGNLDPHTLLYRAASQKKKFKRYIQRFESFLTNVCKTALRTAKVYMPDSAVIAAVGKQESVNIAEFRAVDPQHTVIKVEAQSDDIESKLGRQLVMNHVLQYVGTQLDPSVIGKMITLMPYADVESSFSDLTIDYENATNDILALDRGELPMINEHDNHEYVVKRLTQRMKQADFRMLPPEIQQNYQAVMQAHMDIMRAQKDAILREQAGMIPASGTLVGVDFYVADPNNPERTRRARLPYDAVNWLVQKLDAQAGILQMLEEEIPMSAVAGTQGVMTAGGPQGEIIDPTLLL